MRECRGAVDRLKTLGEEFKSVLEDLKSEAVALIPDADKSIGCDETTDADEVCIVA